MTERSVHLIAVILGLFVWLEIGAIPGVGASADQSLEKTLIVTGSVDLEIVPTSGDIAVRKGESGIVQVKGTRHTKLASVGGTSNVQWQLPIRQDGNHIRIEGEGGRTAAPLDYEIETPDQTHLTIHTSSGDVSAEGITGPLNVSTEAGDIHLNSIGDGIEVRTVNGDVTISLASGGKVEIKTASGDVRLHLPLQGGFDLAALTSSSEISVASGLSLDGKTTGRSVVGKLRGGGTPVVIKTASSDVRID